MCYGSYTKNLIIIIHPVVHIANCIILQGAKEKHIIKINSARHC